MAPLFFSTFWKPAEIPVHCQKCGFSTFWKPGEIPVQCQKCAPLPLGHVVDEQQKQVMYLNLQQPLMVKSKGNIVEHFQAPVVPQQKGKGDLSEQVNQKQVNA